jgi:hypothetical protein
MHIASSFVLAYYLLTLFTSFHGMEEYYTQHHQNPINMDQAGPFSKLTTQPTGDTSLLPPKLDRSLLLDHISERYSDPHTAERRLCHDKQPQQLPQPPSARRCPVSWLIEALPGSYSTDATMEYFRPYLAKATPQQWVWFNAGVRQRPKFSFTPVPVVDKKLSDYVGPGTNRTMTLEFHEPNDPIRSVTVFYVQQSETKWRGMEMTVSVFSVLDDSTGNTNHTKEEHQGNEARRLIARKSVTNYNLRIHRDDKVSTTIDLIPPQSHFQVEFKHTGGITFRMTGIAICH